MLAKANYDIIALFGFHDFRDVPDAHRQAENVEKRQATVASVCFLDEQKGVIVQFYEGLIKDTAGEFNLVKRYGLDEFKLEKNGVVSVESILYEAAFWRPEADPATEYLQEILKRIASAVELIGHNGSMLFEGYLGALMVVTPFGSADDAAFSSATKEDVKKLTLEVRPEDEQRFTAVLRSVARRIRDDEQKHCISQAQMYLVRFGELQEARKL